MPDEYAKSFAAMWQRNGIGDPAYDNNLELALNHLRPMLETCLALVLGNLFGRFPDLRVASVELGSAWVDFCLYTLDHSGGLLGRHVEAYGVTVDDLPSDIFKEHVWVSPFPEDDIGRLVDAIGADRVLLGSDWPHLEGTPGPSTTCRSSASSTPTAFAGSCATTGWSCSSDHDRHAGTVHGRGRPDGARRPRPAAATDPVARRSRQRDREVRRHPRVPRGVRAVVARRVRLARRSSTRSTPCRTTG